MPGRHLYRPHFDRLPKVPPRVMLTGLDRADFVRKVVAAYMVDEASIREICEKTGRSYGAIHYLLSLADNVTLRPARRRY